MDVDETPRAGETPRDYVERLAIEKAQGVFTLRPDATVLGADTTVVVDGRVLGKPVDEVDATAMLGAIQGREHQVLTGVALIGPGGVRSGIATTRVWIAELSAAEIEWYVRSGEPMDKAGAYGIQGLASRFVTRIDGSYTNVVGLPVPLVLQLLG